jgi:hypothetical protein
MRSGGVVGVVVALVLAFAPAAHAGGPLNVPWPALLPPLDDNQQIEPQRVAWCPVANDGCVQTAVDKMDALRTRFGCDHRAIFAVTYERLTQTFQDFLNPAKHPSFFADRERLIYEDALFAEYYFQMHKANDEHRFTDVPEAWQIALKAAASGDVSAVQDMLLGINAHVQRDMPFVLAGVGLRQRNGKSTKPDHDRVNDILEAAFDPIVKEIAQYYDPNTAVLAPDALPVDNVLGLEMVKVWRENVWRNAERLIKARNDDARYKRIKRGIEANAARWARLIVSVKVPGEPAARNAFCAAHPKPAPGS